MLTEAREKLPVVTTNAVRVTEFSVKLIWSNIAPQFIEFCWKGKCSQVDTIQPFVLLISCYVKITKLPF
jgi:hypothetical protein